MCSCRMLFNLYANKTTVQLHCHTFDINYQFHMRDQNTNPNSNEMQQTGGVSSSERHHHSASKCHPVVSSRNEVSIVGLLFLGFYFAQRS